VTLTSYIRQGISFEIELENPLDEIVVFKVYIEGKGLLGPDQLLFEPQQAKTYTLIFQPLEKFTSTGSITFINEKLGEIWYELILKSKKVEPIQVPLLRAELGKSIFKEIQLSNPSNRPA